MTDAREARDLLALVPFLASLHGHLQLVDARDPVELNPLVPALLHHVAGPGVIPQLMSRLLRVYPSDHAATLFCDAGGDRTRDIELARLDPETADEKIVALYLPPLSPENATSSPFGLRAIVHRLRAPGGCPWDRKQTPASLVPFMLEEAYEATDAIEDGDREAIREELGDVLLQVYLQSEIAEESGDFDLNDVFRSISEKLVRRHPHVFAGLQVGSAEQVEINWERLKLSEKGRSPSLVDNIPRSLPALARAQEVQRSLAGAGFDWPSKQGAWDKLEEELAELRGARSDAGALAAELGDVLFMLAKLATDAGLDAESTLRRSIQRVSARMRFVEQAAAARGADIKALSLEELVGFWEQAKQAEHAS